MRPVTRITPKLPARAMKTYSILAPPSTHFREATCEEAGCLAMRNGWQTTVHDGNDLGQRQAHYIRRLSGRSFTEERVSASIVVFTFTPGQECFNRHQVRINREPLYVVTGGDYRGNPLRIPTRRHTSAQSFVDDFASHQQTLADRLERG